MELRSISSEWYEAYIVGSHGSKMPGSYDTRMQAEVAVKEAKNRAVEFGRKPYDYFIVRCTCVKLIEDNGDIVSETITRARVVSMTGKIEVGE